MNGGSGRRLRPLQLMKSTWFFIDWLAVHRRPLLPLLVMVAGSLKPGTVSASDPTFVAGQPTILMILTTPQFAQAAGSCCKTIPSSGIDCTILRMIHLSSVMLLAETSRSVPGSP
jgi:hypothetical protein